MGQGAAALSVSFVQWLNSDEVSSQFLVVGVPACALLIAYAWTIGRRATLHGVQPGPLPYVLTAAAGVSISLAGQVVASELACIAAAGASPGDFGATSMSTYLGVSLLWPAGWCLLALAIPAAKRRLGLPGRSALIALAIGLLVSLLTFVILIGFGAALPIGLRVPSFATLLVVAGVLLVLTGRRSPDLRPAAADG